MTTTITGNNNANLISTAATTTGNNFQFTPLNEVDVVALEGNDTVLIANNNQLSAATIRGGLGADSIVLGTNTTLNSFVFSGQGNDTVVIGTALNSTIQDIYGNNVYDFTAATSLNLAYVQNGDGNDSVRVQGTTQFSTIRGGAGNDTYTLTGNITGSQIFSGQGDDSVAVAGTITDSLIQDIYGTNRHSIVTANNTTVIGGSGVDTVQITNAASNGTLIRAAEGNDSISITGTYTGSSVFGGEGDDTLLITGVATNSQFQDENGNNIFNIANTAYGSNGNLFVGTATSKLRMAINGVTTAETFFGANSFQGGIRTVTNDAANSQLTISDNAYARGIRVAEALTGTASLISFATTAAASNVTMLGAEAADTLTSGAGADSVSGSGGDDQLVSAAGTDTVSAGIGNDQITAGDGADVIDGGVGDDTFQYLDSAQLVAANALVDSIVGGDGTDVINLNAAVAFTVANTDSFARASSVESITTVANAANISLTLAATAFTAGIRTVNLAGDINAAGANTINATTAVAGQDLTLTGSAGADAITGGAGSDTITGGALNDVMAGGAGGVDQHGTGNNFGAVGTSVVASATTFTAGGLVAGESITFATGAAGSVDRITDFVSGNDKLDVVNANTAPTTLIGFAAGGLTNNTTFVVYGSYAAGTGVFTTAAAYGAGNTDALVVTGDGGLTKATSTGYQVLQGLNQALVAADFV